MRVVLKGRTEFTFWQKNNLDLGEHEESHLERRGSGGAGGGALFRVSLSLQRVATWSMNRRNETTALLFW